MSRWLVLLLLVTAFLWIGTLTAYTAGYERLPERVPTHFNAQGEADDWTKREHLLPFWLIMPGFVTMLAALGALLPRLWPSAFAVAGIHGRFESLLCVTALMMTAVQAMVIASSFEVKFDFGRWVLVLVFATVGIMGYSMRNLPRNPIIGIRMPWTLRSDAVWNATHRGASRIYLVVGLAGALAAASGVLSHAAGLAAAVVVLLLSVGVVPIFYSLILARSMKA